MGLGTGITSERLAVGIVADDLTGANDSAVQFARAGWVASLGLLSRPGESIDGGAVHALVADSRAQNHEAARISTATAANAVRAANATRLFLKIDSTMRGSVLAQIEGALASWATNHPDCFAVVCPAYPGMGRTVVAGQLLVNGARVETTSIGTDPVTPVTTSDLATLLPGSVRVEIGEVDAATAARRIEAATASGARIIVVDAETDAQLAEIAVAVAGLGARAVPVGAAGLAVAMATAWAPGSVAPTARVSAKEAIDGAQADHRRVLYVISSLHDVSRTQLQHLTEAGGPDGILTLAPSLDDVLNSETIGAWARAQLVEFAGRPECREHHEPLPSVIVVATPDARAAASAPATPATLDSPAERETAANTIATSLALITDAVFHAARIDALVLVGGEGARAVLTRLGARSIRVLDSIREGIPLGSITGGTANGLTVLTKAGGFGTPTVLAELASELTINSQGARP